METEFKEGDKVYHKAKPNIKWIIEKIDGDKAHCSTLNDELKKVVEEFALVTIEKYTPPQFIIDVPRRNNHY
jgi:hypothetical protein